MATIDILKKARLEKLDKIRKLGIDPYPPVIPYKHKISDTEKLHGKKVTIAGRILSIRGHGKIIFSDIKDESGKIQIVFKSDLIKADNFNLVELLDIGDFISVTGKVDTTSAGQLSLFTDSFVLASKAVRPLPDKWYGLKDIEERYRKRYLDMILNPQVKKVLDSRWKVERSIREFMWNENYTEVETPILQPLYGGTNARPFTTFMNALDHDFYLRIAPELYLKRLIVGGYERVFEIARNFRNEGIDLVHQPEFTMMEFYEAYADYFRIMDLTENLTRFVAFKVNNSYKLQVGDNTVDLEKPWRRLTIDEIVKEKLNIDWEKITDNDIKKILDKNKFEVPGVYSKNKALFVIYEHLVTEKLLEPTWVIDYPLDVSPLSKSHRSKPGRVERFEGYIGGREIFDGWSEIVSAIEQRERFEKEQSNLKAGDSEAQPLDEEFLEALEYGCPPLGGIGIGIDRLTMLMTNTWAIREVIPFPTLRPKDNDKKPSVKTLSAPVSIKFKIKKTAIKINRQKAWELLNSHMKNQNLIRHCLSVEVVMIALAKHFNEDEELWGIVGLLHDGDYEEVKDDVKMHTIKMAQWLKEAGETNEDLLSAILSHNFSHTGQNPPKNNLEWSLFCCDELTGLVVAVALVKDKKLVHVDVDSVLHKFPAKHFAGGVKREQIAMCKEKLGIELPDFIGIALKSMQEIHELLGL